MHIKSSCYCGISRVVWGFSTAAAVLLVLSGHSSSGKDRFRWFFPACSLTTLSMPSCLQTNCSFVTVLCLPHLSPSLFSSPISILHSDPFIYFRGPSKPLSNVYRSLHFCGQPFASSSRLWTLLAMHLNFQHWFSSTFSSLFLMPCTRKAFQQGVLGLDDWIAKKFADRCLIARFNLKNP